MATPPKWVRSPQTAIALPIDDAPALISQRIEDAEAYLEETRREREGLQTRLTAAAQVENAARQQVDYWKQVLTALLEPGKALQSGHDQVGDPPR